MAVTHECESVCRVVLLFSLTLSYLSLKDYLRID